MATFLILAVLVQGDCAQAMADASARLEQFDLAAAAARMQAAADTGCDDARVAALYLQGLVDARAAFRQGAPPPALTPVRTAITSLERIAAGRPGSAAIARLLLQAAAAGAQSERAEMALYLDSGARAEVLQRAAGQPGAPLVSSLELAGDLWLQLFDYVQSRRAYLAAIEQGRTMRATAGLARASARLGMDAVACAEYRLLVARWGSRTPRPAELADADAYLQRAACGGTAAP